MHVLRQKSAYFFFEKRVKFPAFFSSLPKRLNERTLIPSASRLPSLFWQSPYFRRHVTEYRKRHPNLVNARWLRKISRGNRANQKRRVILNE